MCAKSSCTWKDLGRELLSKENYNELEIISNENNDLKYCCSAMFRLWLERQPKTASWRRLVEALKELQLNHLVGEIESNLKAGFRTLSWLVIELNNYRRRK